MVAIAAMPMQDDRSAVDVLLKPDSPLATAAFTARRHPEGDRRVGHEGGEPITSKFGGGFMEKIEAAPADYDYAEVGVLR